MNDLADQFLKQENWPLVGVAAAIGALLGLLLLGWFVARKVKKRQEKILLDRQDQFIGLASHYLLTPISIIQTAANELNDREDTMSFEQRRKMYAAIIRGERRLYYLSEQFRLAGDIDQNKLHIRIAVANLNDVVSDAVEDIHPIAQDKKVQVQVSFTDIGEARFDAKLIKIALVALLDNAVKFSPENTIIKVTTGIDNSGVLSVSINDQGVGMTDSILSNLTEKFFRGSDLYSFDYEGIGLGLYVAQAIIRSHFGNITFDSVPKKGTLALVEFPRS